MKRLACLIVAACAAASAAEPAPAARDPMQPPAAALPASAATPRDTADETPRQIVVVGGKRYLVDRGRRLSAGDLLGSRRIERIDGDALWLRDAQGVQRVPLYPGVTRRAASGSSPSSPSPSRPLHKEIQP